MPSHFRVPSEHLRYCTGYTVDALQLAFSKLNDARVVVKGRYDLTSFILDDEALVIVASG